MTTPALALGIVSDEISLDFTEAVQHGLAWGIRRYELRCLTSGRVPAVGAEDLDTVQRLTARHDLKITALSPGIFKHPVSAADEIEQELNQTLPATLVLAKALGTDLIIVFGFKRGAGLEAEERARAVHYFRRAAALAAGEGVRLAIENEPGFLCDSGSHTRDIIREAATPWLGANWDPCNAFGTDEAPYPAGYEAIRSVIFNVHVKDTQAGSLIRCVPVGQGAIDWRGQLAALVRDRTVRHVTIETHCLPLVEKSAENVRVLSAMLEEISHD